MTLAPRDPLLAAARLLLIFMMAMMALIGLIGILAVPSLFLFKAQFLAELAENGLPPGSLAAFAGAGTLFVICVGLGFLFFRNLYRIVGSVGEGDPFIPVNAERLSGMGWIVVAAHVVAVPLFGILHWLSSVSDEIKADGEFDIGGVLLALILFILARVFRHGAAMREELEGTV